MLLIFLTCGRTVCEVRWCVWLVGVSWMCSVGLGSPVSPVSPGGPRASGGNSVTPQSPLRVKPQSQSHPSVTPPAGRRHLKTTFGKLWADVYLTHLHLKCDSFVLKVTFLFLLIFVNFCIFLVNSNLC